MIAGHGASGGRPRWPALAVSLVVAALVLGCGDEGEGGSSATSDRDAPSADATAATTSAERRSREGLESPPPRVQPRRSPSRTGGDDSIQRFGAAADPDDERAAIEVVNTFNHALARDRWQVACDALASTARAQLAQSAALPRRGALDGPSDLPEPDAGDCAEALAKVVGSSPRDQRRRLAASTVFTGVRVDGDEGFVLFRSASTPASAIPVLREDGEWRVGVLAGVPL